MGQGDADAGRGAHGGGEIIREGRQPFVEDLDRLTELAQARVGVAQDRQEGHGFSGRRCLPS